MLQKERDALTGFLEVDAVIVAVEREVDVAADRRVEARRWSRGGWSGGRSKTVRRRRNISGRSENGGSGGVA